MLRVLALALSVALTCAACDEGPAPEPRGVVADPQPGSLAVSEVASFAVDPARLRMLGLGPAYVAWEVARTDAWEDGPRRVVVAALDGGARRTVYRSAYDGGEIGGLEPMAGRVLVVDTLPGESDHGPPAAWRLVAVALDGRRRVLAESEPGVASWAPWPVSNGDVAGWVLPGSDPSVGGVAFTWESGAGPRRWGAVGRSNLAGVTADGLLLERIGRDQVRGLYREDLLLRTRSGVRDLTDDGLVVEADVDGSTLVWSERADRGHQLADPVEIHVLDLAEPDQPAAVHAGSTGYELRAGAGFVLWSGSGSTLGLRVAPAEGGDELRLPGRRIRGTSNGPDVRGDRVAYVQKTSAGPRLVVLEVR